MKYSRRSRESIRNATVLVDFDNLQKVVTNLAGEIASTGSIVSSLVEEIRQYAADQLHLNPVRTVVVASSSSDRPVESGSFDSWLSCGIEPRLISAGTGEEAGAIELTIDACRMLHSDRDIRAFILISGDRWLVPLTQELQRHGKFVMVSTIKSPDDCGMLPADVVDAYFNSSALLERLGLSTDSESVIEDDSDFKDAESVDERRPEKTAPIEDESAREVLEIIERYFGQYQEVYLTPLLRKLTELVNHEDGPKSVVNYLEECGAVWLEKRRGFPHNYTVLMVNSEHPDVVDIKGQFEDEAPPTDDDDYYEDDEIFEDDRQHEYVDH